MKKILTTLLATSSLILLTWSHTTVALPKGNYKQSCYKCRITPDNRLVCICKDRRGYTHKTSLPRPHKCRFIENLNGNLICTRR